MRFEGCKFLRGVDGDTYDIEVDVSHMDPERPLWHPRIRCSFINAPERGKPGYSEAKEGLAFKLHDRTDLVIETHGRDSFKRLLAETFVDGQPLSYWMIDMGYARKYSLALQLAE